MRLVERIAAIHTALAAAAVPHAFGGALALAWCTRRARGTIDIDLNLFLSPAEADSVLAVMPSGVVITQDNRDQIARDGQTRLWWDRTPVDVFFNTTDFHAAVGSRVRHDELAGHRLPFLACRDLAVFKAFFDRTKDWADLEEMAAAGTLDTPSVIGILAAYLGGDDPRIERLRVVGGYA
ncbi:MAG: hypothetical protein AAF567_08195 [Actinomycetota bacterium]